MRGFGGPRVTFHSDDAARAVLRHLNEAAAADRAAGRASPRENEAWASWLADVMIARRYPVSLTSRVPGEMAWLENQVAHLAAREVMDDEPGDDGLPVVALGVTFG